MVAARGWEVLDLALHITNTPNTPPTLLALAYFAGNRLAHRLCVIVMDLGVVVLDCVLPLDLACGHGP